MAIQPTCPGVYIEEIPSGVRTITGVATSITAFIGRTLRGPLNDPVQISNPGEFEQKFGGLWRLSPMSYAVRQFFENGGSQAVIVRIANNAAPATLDLPVPGGNPLQLSAANPGAWGNRLQATIDHATADGDNTNQFNLLLEELASLPVPGEPPPEVLTREVHRNLVLEHGAIRDVAGVLAAESRLARIAAGSSHPAADRPGTGDPSAFRDGSDGDELDGDGGQISGVGLAAAHHGLYALDRADLFNILCIPPLIPERDLPAPVWTAALAYCKLRRAMLLIDPGHAWNNVDAAEGGIDNSLRDENSAMYFPHVHIPDPLQQNRLRTFPPCGVIAGWYAKTDATRGVWKAPAGIDTRLQGVKELEVKLTDAENGRLNQLGINCLRTFPVIGSVIWGARTLEGADRLASEWKYVPVRRLALYIEESLFRGTQWVVFEPNDEPLWAQIRLNVGAFMQGMFRQGAFQGASPKEAYFVKCDGETTTQNDRNLGRVNILVGFAPLLPAEFVVIQIQQMAGQIET